MFSIAIVGRPNVGKSTLFNKIVGGRPAIVDGVPGVTRDRNVAIVTRMGRKFAVIDSGGFEPESKELIPSLMREQTLMALEEANHIFFVVDGKTDITADDLEIGRRLRKSDKPVTLLVNKLDNPRNWDNAYSFAKLGFDHMEPVSAEHNLGFMTALEAIIAPLPVEEEPELDEQADESSVLPEKPVRIAVVGKPNVGKSSLVNQIIGAERMMVSAVAGTTRDAIDTPIQRGGKEYILIDTAGIRKKAKVTQKLEKYSVIMAMKAISRADFVLLLIDATEGVATQEAKIASLIAEETKPCIIVVNKWDAIAKDTYTVNRYTEQLYTTLPFLSFAPVVFLSAKTGQRVDKLFVEIERVVACASRRIPTAQLNDLIGGIVARKEPPIYRNKRLKFYYTTQNGQNPPSFVFMLNYPEGLSDAYKRFLTNQLRERGEFEITPMRLRFRKPADRRSELGRHRSFRKK